MNNQDLCTICIWAMRSSGVLVTVTKRKWLEDGKLCEDIAEAPVIRIPFIMQIEAHEWRLTDGFFKDVSHLCAGRPQTFITLVRELGPDAVWRIDHSAVYPYADCNVFGMAVCSTHIWEALEIWSGQRRIPPAKRREWRS